MKISFLQYCRNNPFWQYCGNTAITINKSSSGNIAAIHLPDLLEILINIARVLATTHMNGIEVFNQHTIKLHFHMMMNNLENYK